MFNFIGNGFSNNNISTLCDCTPPPGYNLCIRVTDNSDPAIVNPFNNGCGSLRWALLRAQLNTSGATYIKFEIPSNMSKEIAIFTELPSIQGNVFIDGTSQAGYSTIDKAPIITIKSALPEPHEPCTANEYALSIPTGSNAIIKGLRFTKFWRGFLNIGSSSGQVTNLSILDNVFFGLAQTNTQCPSTCGLNKPSCGYCVMGACNMITNFILVIRNVNRMDVFGNLFGINKVGNNMIESISEIGITYPIRIFANYNENNSIYDLKIGDYGQSPNLFYGPQGGSGGKITFFDRIDGQFNISNSVVRNNLFSFQQSSFDFVSNYYHFNNDQYYQHPSGTYFCFARPTIERNTATHLYGKAAPLTNVEVYKYQLENGLQVYKPVGRTKANAQGFWSIASSAFYQPQNFVDGEIFKVISDKGGCNLNSEDSDSYITKSCPTLSIQGAPFITCKNTPTTYPLTVTPSGGSLYGSGVSGTTFNPTGLPTGDTYIYYTIDYNSVPQGCPTSTQVRVTIPPDAKILTNVIEVNAGTFSDAWPTDNQVETTVPYMMNGTKLNWLPEEAYAYVDDREQSNTLNQRTDGLLQNVPWFDWNSTAHGMCYPNWRKVTTITQTKLGTGQIENQDILGNYSTALFGYRDQLSTAVASNAQYHEIAFEGFEEYTINQTLNLSSFSSSNLTIVNENPPSINVDKNLFLDFDIIEGRDYSIVVNFPGNRAQELYGKKVAVFGSYILTNTNKNIHGYYGIKRTDPHSNPNYCTIILEESEVPISGNWVGKIGIPKHLTDDITPVFVVPNGSTKTQIVNAFPSGIDRKAHSGKNFIKVAANTEIEQVQMMLQPGKSYTVSLWISTDDINPSNYYNMYRGVGIDFINSAGAKISMPPTVFTITSSSGTIIEGWQKIEGSFVVPVGAVRFTLKLLTPLNTITYFDDIRIHPTEGNMITYVYNVTDYKLSATLDQNNYATYYYYDENGSLYLLKKETERGVMTIQESYGHTTEINK
jgi:hypothetical protein